jgi:hypothetical protein
LSQEAVSTGHTFDKGSRSGAVEQVSRGIADVGVGDFMVSKERSEEVAFTDTMGLLR